MLDITRDKPIKVAVRVAVPVRDHPKVIIYCKRIHFNLFNGLSIYQYLVVFQFSAPATFVCHTYIVTQE